jgi:GDSL-like Lipase/Acylhydrolase family
MPSNSTEAASTEKPRLWLNLLLSLVVMLVVLLLIEGFSSLLMAVRSARHELFMREEAHSQYDADLGWRHKPSIRIAQQYGPDAPFTTNAAGFRALEEYSPGVPQGRYRVVALGDSFTMGFGVGDTATYPAQMQAACAPLQTINMGQGGYGVDQNYLWYKRDGVAYEANVLLVAAIAMDFYRMGSDNFIGYPKPVLAVDQGKLVVKNVPVPPAWQNRTTLRRLQTFVDSMASVRLGKAVVFRSAAPAPEQFYGAVSDEVLAAAGLALDDLVALSKPKRQQVVLVYLPLKDLLKSEPTPEASWMKAYAARAQIPFIDLTPEFSALSPKRLAEMYRIDNHYSDEGNRLVAQALLKQLGQQVPGFPACTPAPRP